MCVSRSRTIYHNVRRSSSCSDQHPDTRNYCLLYDSFSTGAEMLIYVQNILNISAKLERVGCTSYHKRRVLDIRDLLQNIYSCIYSCISCRNSPEMWFLDIRKIATWLISIIYCNICKKIQCDQKMTTLKRQRATSKFSYRQIHHGGHLKSLSRAKQVEHWL